MKRNFLGMLLVLLLIIFVSSTALSLEKVRIAIIPYQDSYPFVLADELGYYEEEGIDAEFEHLLFFPDVHEALAAGAIDIGPTDAAVLIASYKNYPDITLAFPYHVFHHGYAIMMRPNSNLRSYEDFLKETGDPDIALLRTAEQLKGKTGIAMSGTDQEMPIWALAKVANLKLGEDVKMIDMQPDEGVTAFIAGTGDFFCGGIPQRMAALKHGMVEMITVADMPSEGVVSAPFMAATKEYAEEHWDTLLKLFHIYIKTCKYITLNLDEAAEFISSELNKDTAANMTPQDFIDIFDKWQAFPDSLIEWGYWIGPVVGQLGDRTTWLTGELPRYSQVLRWEKTNEYLLERGLIREEVPIEDNYIYEKLFMDMLNKYGPKG